MVIGWGSTVLDFDLKMEESISLYRTYFICNSLLGHSGSQSSLSDSGSRPTSPSVKEDRKRFEIPKSVCYFPTLPLLIVNPIWKLN